MADNKDIAAMTFEAAMAELEKIVDRLDRGDAPLDESIAIYERGAALKAHCEAKLAAANARVQKIVADGEGKATGVADADLG